MRKDGITKVNLQLFLHHQETPQNSISTAVLIFQVGIVVACMHMRITGAFCEPSEANAAFCAKRKMRGGEKISPPLDSRLIFFSRFELLRSPCLARKAPVMQASIVTGSPSSKYGNRPCCVTFEI